MCDSDDPADDLIRWCESAPPVQLELWPIEAFALVAHLQLALQHPGNRGESAQIARQIVALLQHSFPPAVERLSKLGDNPAFDVERRT